VPVGTGAVSEASGMAVARVVGVNGKMPTGVAGECAAPDTPVVPRPATAADDATVVAGSVAVGASGTAGDTVVPAAGASGNAAHPK